MTAARRATLTRKNLPHFTGVAHLYRLDPPMEHTRGENGPLIKTNYVVVSTVTSPFDGPETSIFRASPEGKILDWQALQGPYRGACKHRQALENAGYIVFDEQ